MAIVLQQFLRKHAVSFTNSKILFATIMLLVLIFGGAGIFRLSEPFDIHTAIYFCVVTSGQVGYGDLSPKSGKGRIFDSFYIILGLIIVGYSITITSELFLEFTVKGKKKRLTKFMKTAVLDVEIPKNRCAKCWARYNKLVITLCVVVVLLLVGAAVVQYLEKDAGKFDWSYSNALYFMFITATTVGYGDFFPITFSGRIVVEIWILIGTAILGLLIAQVGDLTLKKSSKALLQSEEESTKEFIGQLDEAIGPALEGMTPANQHYISCYLQERLVMVEKVEPQPPRPPKKPGLFKRHLIAFSRLKVLVALCALAILCAIGGAVVKALEGYDIETSIYFSVITVSTVGYGDILPISGKTKIWVFFYVIFGVSILAQSVGAIGDAMLQLVVSARDGFGRKKKVTPEQAADPTKDVKKNRDYSASGSYGDYSIEGNCSEQQESVSLQSYSSAEEQEEKKEKSTYSKVEKSAEKSAVSAEKSAVSAEKSGEASASGGDYMDYYYADQPKKATKPKIDLPSTSVTTPQKMTLRERCCTCLKHSDKMIIALSLLVVLVLVGAGIMNEVESKANPAQDWSYGVAVYYMIVTLSTVGYGDFFPITTGGRATICVWIFMGLGLVGVLIGQLGEMLLRRAQAKIAHAAVDPLELLIKLDDIMQLELLNVTSEEDLTTLKKFLREKIFALNHLKDPGADAFPDDDAGEENYYGDYPLSDAPYSQEASSVSEATGTYSEEATYSYA